MVGGHRMGRIARLATLAVAMACSWTLAAPTPAWAQAAPAPTPAEEPVTEAPAAVRAGLMPITFEGDFNEGWRETLQQDLRRGLTQAGFEVVEPQRVEEASGVSECANAKCLRFMAASVEARFLVRARIEVQRRNYAVGIDIIDGISGTLAASSRESCQLCGLSEVGELLATQAAVLRAKADVLALEPAVVAIASDPPGATIWIDGESIGTAPLEHELSAGQHRATARKPGYIEQILTIETVQGVRERVSFELLPAPVAKDLGPDPAQTAAAAGSCHSPIGWSMVGVGVAGLGAGVTFLVLDEVPYRSRCSGADVDPLGNCRQRYDTLTHGAYLAATGGALLVTGAALLIAARVRRGRRAKAMAHRLHIGPAALGARF